MSRDLELLWQRALWAQFGVQSWEFEVVNWNVTVMINRRKLRTWRVPDGVFVFLNQKISIYFGLWQVNIETILFGIGKTRKGSEGRLPGDTEWCWKEPSPSVLIFVGERSKFLPWLQLDRRCGEERLSLLIKGDSSRDCWSRVERRPLICHENHPPVIPH